MTLSPFPQWDPEAKAPRGSHSKICSHPPASASAVPNVPASLSFPEMNSIASCGTSWKH